MCIKRSIVVVVVVVVVGTVIYLTFAKNSDFQNLTVKPVFEIETPFFQDRLPYHWRVTNPKN